MVIMDQYTRRIIGFALHAGNVDGPTLCGMFNDATSGQGWLQRIRTDNDPLFQDHRWKANLRVMEMSLISVTTAGNSTVSGYFSFRWLLEVVIRQGHGSFWN